MMKKIVLALCVIGVATAQENFKDCLEQDSISCVQMTVRTITGLPSHFFDNWMKVGTEKTKTLNLNKRRRKKEKKTSKKNKNIITKREWPKLHASDELSGMLKNNRASFESSERKKEKFKNMNYSMRMKTLQKFPCSDRFSSSCTHSAVNSKVQICLRQTVIV